MVRRTVNLTSMKKKLYRTYTVLWKMIKTSTHRYKLCMYICIYIIYMYKHYIMYNNNNNNMQFSMRPQLMIIIIIPTLYVTIISRIMCVSEIRLLADI